MLKFSEKKGGLSFKKGRKILIHVKNWYKLVKKASKSAKCFFKKNNKWIYENTLKTQKKVYKKENIFKYQVKNLV